VDKKLLVSGTLVCGQFQKWRLMMAKGFDILFQTHGFLKAQKR